MFNHGTLPSERIRRVLDLASDDCSSIFFSPAGNRSGRQFSLNDPFSDQFLRHSLRGCYAVRQQDKGAK
jgi:hypothetical protein